MAWRAIRKIDFTFTSITRSQSSSFSSKTEARRMIPALLKRMLTPAKRSRARSTMRRQSAAWVTSTHSKCARPPADDISRSTCNPPASFTSANETDAPSRANNKAVARPIPEAAPVMIADFPCKHWLSISFPTTPATRRHLSASQSACRLCTIASVHMSRDVSGIVGREEGEECSDFFWLSVTMQGDLAINLLQHLVCVFSTLHRGEHVTGGHRADSHLWSKFQGHRFCQFNNTGLRGVIVGVKRLPYQPVSRSCLQNHPSVMLHHVTCRCLRDIEQSRQVHGNHLVPLRWRDVQEIVPNADTRVID